MDTKIIHVIIGPTASGKSALALSKASNMNGVIINCDAMQSYDALHVLTAQPDAEEQAQAPHKLYGFLHPSTHYSAAAWRADAIHEIDAAFDSGQTPILCGGTGFYLKSLMHGLSPMPDTLPDVRDAATALQKEMGNPAFHEMLKEYDPETAARLEPMNTHRNIRAWEVLQATGKPLSYWQDLPLIPPPEGWDFHVTAVLPDRAELYDKINARLLTMIDLGILDEVRDLDTQIQAGEVPTDALITKAHGFRLFRSYLDGASTLDDAIERTQTETRQYAKKQMTWLRNQITIDEVLK